MKKVRFAILMVVLLLFFASTAFAGSGTSKVTLAWDPPDIDTDVTGYKLHYGSVSGVYTTHIDAGNVLTYVFPELPDGAYYFVANAYNSAGMESVYSNEVTVTLKTPPDAPKNLRSVSVEVNINLTTGVVTVKTVVK